MIGVLWYVRCAGAAKIDIAVVFCAARLANAELFADSDAYG